jgi:hypothetical protein
VFSVRESNVAAVTKYIARQQEHHKIHSFQDEFIAFLKKNDIEYVPEAHLGLASFAPAGACRFPLFTHRLRPGLHSFAACGLKMPILPHSRDSLDGPESPGVHFFFPQM